MFAYLRQRFLEPGARRACNEELFYQKEGCKMRTILGVFTLVLLSAPAFSQTSSRQITLNNSPEARLRDQQTSAPKIESLRVIKYDGNLAYLLPHLAEGFGVTIGFETEPKHPNPRVSLNLLDASLADVLDAIVKAAPTYRWHERNGYIEVLPVGATSPLLDTMIRAFRVSDVDQSEAVSRLLSQADVQANLRAMGLTRKVTGGASIQPTSKKFSMSLDGVTMREALARIANESGGRFWIFQTLGDGFISISN
jgi:hypothetical protein